MTSRETLRRSPVCSPSDFGTKYLAKWASTINPQTPCGFEHVVVTCLRKDPDERYLSATTSSLSCSGKRLLLDRGIARGEPIRHRGYKFHSWPEEVGPGRTLQIHPQV